MIGRSVPNLLLTGMTWTVKSLPPSYCDTRFSCNGMFVDVAGLANINLVVPSEHVVLTMSSGIDTRKLEISCVSCVVDMGVCRSGSSRLMFACGIHLDEAIHAAPHKASNRGRRSTMFSCTMCVSSGWRKLSTSKSEKRVEISTKILLLLKLFSSMEA